MASLITIPGDQLEGILLDGVYEAWKSIEVLHDQHATGWPDMDEARCLTGTDLITGMHLRQLHDVIKGYSPAALRKNHRTCQEILLAWHEGYVAPDGEHPEGELTARWMKNTLDTVTGLHNALFADTERQPKSKTSPAWLTLVPDNMEPN